ncbi:hypothetical protein FSP39_020541 [Pinctada imbricata]|uniref:Uncharacterized protein n=1 Tax=Pinctada imbricata TaxID=66713 RepID=A0AA88XNC1_PINIB|nr:hypothetical protein FSP39_020541 [Pinctada imbricata]
MPLCPPARRNWDREAPLTRGNVNLTWPPHKWRQMSPDQKLLQWEFASMRFEQEISDCWSLERGELLDKYNFLALPGSKIPPYDSPMRKARYYTYETLRTSPSAELLKQMLLAREARDTSVDDLIRTLNKRGVPLRL